MILAIDQGTTGTTCLVVWHGRERGETVAVPCLEHEVLVRDGCAAKDRDRRQGVELEAHGRASLAQEPLAARLARQARTALTA